MKTITVRQRSRPFRVDVEPCNSNRALFVALVTFPSVFRRVVRDANGVPARFESVKAAKAIGSMECLRMMNDRFQSSEAASSSALEAAEALFGGSNGTT